MFLGLILDIVTISYKLIILLLFARAIMSWFVRDTSHPIVNFVYSVTEPILLPMRMLFDKYGINSMGIDLSFIATFFAIEFIFRLIISILLRIVTYY
ncbi:MAG: hypothetical protein CSB15_01055 [Clostridiales bacterium]|nr:MAG: hypothetical protein CSB15_01055 [Clostridiales bacterium]